jgi:hypothetical protein
LFLLNRTKIVKRYNLIFLNPLCYHAGMPKDRTKGKHGGPRPGAGRKRQFEEPKMLGVVMERADYEAIERLAGLAGKSASEWAREKLLAAVRRAAK